MKFSMHTLVASGVCLRRCLCTTPVRIRSHFFNLGSTFKVDTCFGMGAEEFLLRILHTRSFKCKVVITTHELSYPSLQCLVVAGVHCGQHNAGYIATLSYSDQYRHLAATDTLHPAALHAA